MSSDIAPLETSLTCRSVSQAHCAGSCKSDLVCLANASCSCVKAIGGEFLARTDGAVR